MNEVAIPDERTAIAIGRPVDHHILTDHVVISDHQQSIRPLILKILRLRAQDRVLENPVSRTHTRPAHHAHMRHDLTVVTNLDILVDVSERMDRHILPDLRARVDIR